MTKDIQKLTQNERYDLKRKQVMEEKEAYTNSSLENFTKHCFSRRLIDRLTEENQRLKEQNARLQSELDKTIKQLKDYEKALKDYADGYNYAYVDNGFAFYSNQYSNEGLAQEVLEKWKK